MCFSMSWGQATSCRLTLHVESGHGSSDICSRHSILRSLQQQTPFQPHFPPAFTMYLCTPHVPDYPYVTHGGMASHDLHRRYTRVSGTNTSGSWDSAEVVSQRAPKIPRCPALLLSFWTLVDGSLHGLPVVLRILCNWTRTLPGSSFAFPGWEIPWKPGDVGPTTYFVKMGLL